MFIQESRVASLLVPAILNGQTGNQDPITCRYLWVRLRTASSIFDWFINLFMNYISSSPKYTRAWSAEQLHGSRSPSWLIVVGGVFGVWLITPMMDTWTSADLLHAERLITVNDWGWSWWMLWLCWLLPAALCNYSLEGTAPSVGASVL